MSGARLRPAHGDGVRAAPAGTPASDARAQPAVVRAEAAGGDVQTVARWLGPAQRPLLGWVSARRTAASASGVLILPPVGYQWWSAHRTLRTLAERLAAAGHVVLRLDYDGTGDSAGDHADPARVDAWRASVRAGAAELRALGCTRITLVGARLGGLLALLEAQDAGAQAVVGWAPVGSGRRYVRELRLLSDPVPGEEGALASAGTLFTAQTLEALAALGSPPAPAPGLRVEVVEGGGSALDVAAEDASVPEDVVDALVSAVGPPAAATIAPPPPRASATFAAVRETVVGLGPGGLVGVLTEPARASARRRPLVVFLNSGSEPHVGPGRAWVQYARALAARGTPALRADFSGWGESPDRGHAPGRPYDPHTVGEVAEIVAGARALGHERVVLAGLCAGAWVALRAVLERPVAGVVALNPQLYWRPGDPVEATMAQTRARRAAEIERIAARRRVWSALDVVGQRPWAGRWLDELAAGGVPVLMLFAEGDDGLEYLWDRLARRLAAACRRGGVRVAELAAIDHAMHRVWLRAAVVDAIDRFAKEIP